MSSYLFDDIYNWDLEKVKRYIKLIGLKNIYFKNNINNILEFAEKNNLDGSKLIWLISKPYEPLLLTGGHLSVANKVKNLDSIIWKGIRWKYLLEPIILLSEGEPGSTIYLNENMGIILNIIENNSKIKEDKIDRLYSNKAYSYEVE